MRQDHERPEKKTYQRYQLEVLGINTAKLSDAEVNLLQLIRPKLEAYREYLTRQTTTQWTDVRAYEIVLRATDDEKLAGDTASAITFAQERQRDPQ